MQSVNAASKSVFFKLWTTHDVLHEDEYLQKQLSLRRFKSHVYQLMRTLLLEDIASSSVLLPPHLCSAASHGISTYVSDDLREIPQCILSNLSLILCKKNGCFIFWYLLLVCVKYLILGTWIGASMTLRIVTSLELMQ